MNNFYDKKYRILVTGGAGFIGGALIRYLLKETNCKIFNLDKISYASDLESINQLIYNEDGRHSNNYELIKADLSISNEVEDAINYVNPDLIFHLAAESHVDRSIDNPINFINSNLIGTFNLMQSSLKYWENLSIKKKEIFKVIHVSTDEVFGSIEEGSFDENSKYDPRSPYSASKAASDHIAIAWNHTYTLPTIVTNCSNNYGPWQFPEKFIPLSILNGINKKEINIYGNGTNIRDWIHVEDHVEALIMIAKKGSVGSRYCIGGDTEKTNIEVVKYICELLDHQIPHNVPHENLIKFVEDRPGHDKRYSINAVKLKKELGWFPKKNFHDGIRNTVLWYLNNSKWCKTIYQKSGYQYERLGLKRFS